MPAYRPSRKLAKSDVVDLQAARQLNREHGRKTPDRKPAAGTATRRKAV